MLALSGTCKESAREEKTKASKAAEDLEKLQALSGLELQCL